MFQDSIETYLRLQVGNRFFCIFFLVGQDFAQLDFLRTFVKTADIVTCGFYFLLGNRLSFGDMHCVCLAVQAIFYRLPNGFEGRFLVVARLFRFGTQFGKRIFKLCRAVEFQAFHFLCDHGVDHFVFQQGLAQLRRVFSTAVFRLECGNLRINDGTVDFLTVDGCQRLGKQAAGTGKQCNGSQDFCFDNLLSLNFELKCSGRLHSVRRMEILVRGSRPDAERVNHAA